MKQKNKDLPKYTPEELDQMIAQIDEDMKKLSKNPSSSYDWLVSRWKRTKEKLEHIRKKSIKNVR